MPELRIAQWVDCTEAEGPFRRSAVWVRGCSLRCPGCCNPELFEAIGPTTSIEAMARRLERARDRFGVEGLTVLGGEPLEQLSAVTALAQAARRIGLGVIVFTGYRRAELDERPGFEELWSTIDLLVDGRFVRTRPEPVGGRPVIGSANQHLLHATDRYAEPALWDGGERPTELRVEADGSIWVLGAAPDAARVARWAGRGPDRAG